MKVEELFLRQFSSKYIFSLLKRWWKQERLKNHISQIPKLFGQLLEPTSFILDTIKIKPLDFFEKKILLLFLKLM